MKHSARAHWAVPVIAVVVGLFALQPHWAVADTDDQADAQELRLITDTPEEGFALAISLSRKGVTATQPDKEVLQTVAAANDYWR